MGIETFENVVGSTIKPCPTMAAACHTCLGTKHFCRVQWLPCPDLLKAA